MNKSPVRPYWDYARGGNNTTRRFSVGYDVDFVNIECNGIEGERDTGTLMESMVWAIANVANNAEFS